jgi:hypothetical protein
MTGTTTAEWSNSAASSHSLELQVVRTQQSKGGNDECDWKDRTK